MVVRLAVDHVPPYRLPAGNPFAADTAALGAGEIWDYGLRNPWRFSFDRATGDLYIGDVGEGLYEEVDVEQSGGGGGGEYGGDVLEGQAGFHPHSGDLDRLAAPGGDDPPCRRDRFPARGGDCACVYDP